MTNEERMKYSEERTEAIVQLAVLCFVYDATMNDDLLTKFSGEMVRLRRKIDILDMMLGTGDILLPENRSFHIK